MDMKKIFSFVVLALLSIFGAANASAQLNWGVLGGATFSSAKPSEWKNSECTQYHVGATLKLSLPLGFAVQPSVLYQVKGSQINETDFGEAFKYISGFVEVPVSVQWGPDLLIMRPYFECVPFVGYALHNAYKAPSAIAKNNWKGINRWEYGLGLGAGVEVWHFQISARYNWNFGALMDSAQLDDSLDDFPERMNYVLGSKKNKKYNFGGVTLSLAVLF